MYFINRHSHRIAKNIAKKCAFQLKCNQRCYSFNEKTIILGIETSCDDTGIAILNEKGSILGDSLYSQNTLHIRLGGVNPLIARDFHRYNIDIAVNEALKKADLKVQDINYVAVTVKPGLLVSLQIGVKYAKYLSKTYNKTLIPIHHMEAHALVARMYHNIDFPFLALLISGGHCLLTVVQNVDDFLLLGNSLDNAPGEVMDKAARRMKLKNIPIYSQTAGGRAIEMAARCAKNPDIFEFTRPLIKNRDCNFSFSGVKDALIRQLVKKEQEHNIKGDELIPEVYDLCAAYQTVIAEHIVHRTERAVQFCLKNRLLNDKTKSIVVSGGVACNDFIFKSIEYIGHKLGCKVYRPPPKVCTDNGIMIAWNGLEKLRSQCHIENVTIDSIVPKAPLGTNIIDEVRNANLYVKATRLKGLLLD